MRSERWRLWALGVFVLAGLGVLFSIPAKQRRATNDPAVFGNVRALVTAMTHYAQSHGNDYPPPDQMRRLLLADVSPEMFGDQSQTKGEAVFQAIVLENSYGRWTNAFDAARPLVYSGSPGLASGFVAVGYSDGHVDVLSTAQLSAMLKAVSGRVEPVR